MPAADLHPLGVDLPGPPHRRIDQGGFAPAVGRLFGNGDELLGLHGQQRQGNGAHARHLQAWRKYVDRAGGIKITGTLHRLQYLGQLGGESCHTCCPFSCHHQSSCSRVQYPEDGSVSSVDIDGNNAFQIKAIAQCLTFGSASNLAETRGLSSPVQGSSPTKT